jgi:hypothetical protein
LFAGQCERHKDGFARYVGEKRAAIDWFFNLNELRLSELGLHVSRLDGLGAGAIWFGPLHCWLI